MIFTTTYYRIRFTGPCQYYKAGDFYSSNNGTDRWSSLSKIKATLTRGIPCGYRGRSKVDFDNYEIVEFTEVVDQTEKVITL